MSSELQNLVSYDPDFSESRFRSKVENEFVKIKLSIVTGKTERIKHFVSDDVYAKIVAKVEEDAKNNRIQMYDELNVFEVTISRIEELEDKFRIVVSVHSKALTYYLNKTNRKFLSGNNQYRTDAFSTLVFEKLKQHEELGAARRCPYCAATLDINNNGICNFCGNTFPLENYDWVITQMDI